MVNTTDRELLELAAKAAGIRVVRSRLEDPMHVDLLIPNSPRNTTSIYGGWNPLTDDGDALRLAVKLDIDLTFYTDKEAKVYAQTKHLLGYGTDGYASYQAHEYHKELYEGSDPYAATRRAIVCAAAEIGRALP